MEDVYKVFNLDTTTQELLESSLTELSESALSMVKVNLIRQALNKGKDMQLTEGEVWYPYAPFVTENSNYYKNELENGTLKEVARFVADGKNISFLVATLLLVVLMA